MVILFYISMLSCQLIFSLFRLFFLKERILLRVQGYSLLVIYRRHYFAADFMIFCILKFFCLSLSLSCRSCVIDLSVKAGHPTVSSSLYFDQLLSVTISFSWKKKSFFDAGWDLYLSVGIRIRFLNAVRSHTF